jgi:hypothetical protein
MNSGVSTPAIAVYCCAALGLYPTNEPEPLPGNFMMVPGMTLSVCRKVNSGVTFGFAAVIFADSTSVPADSVMRTNPPPGIEDPTPWQRWVSSFSRSRPTGFRIMKLRSRDAPAKKCVVALDLCSGEIVVPQRRRRFLPTDYAHKVTSGFSQDCQYVPLILLSQSGVETGRCRGSDHGREADVPPIWCVEQQLVNPAINENLSS